MKVKKDYILRQVADEYILIPVGQAALNTKGLIRLSESGYLLYERMQKECDAKELVELLLSEYDVSEEAATSDVQSFLNQMKTIGMLEENAQ